MKVIIGTLERQKQDKHQNGMVLMVMATDSCSFLIFNSSLVLCIVRVLAATYSMRQYLQPIYVAQIVQILHDGTFIPGITVRFGVSPSSVLRALRIYWEISC